MKRLFVWMFAFVVVLRANVGFAQEVTDEILESKKEEQQLKGGKSAPDPETPEGCPIVCSPYEACIAQRCVEMCRTGCRVGTTCTAAGTCQPLPERGVEVLTEAERMRISGAKSADSKTLLLADVGGAIGYGVALGVEHGYETSFLARARFLNTGLMSHAVFQENEFQRFDWGVGGSVAVRHYEAWSGNLRGFYYGGGLDYAAITMSDRVRAGARQTLHSVAPFGEFGYRWVFGRFSLGFGPTIGLRYPIGTGFTAADRVRCGGGRDCEDVNRRRFEGTVHIELGWFRKSHPPRDGRSSSRP